MLSKYPEDLTSRRHLALSCDTVIEMPLISPLSTNSLLYLLTHLLMSCVVSMDTDHVTTTRCLIGRSINSGTSCLHTRTSTLDVLLVCLGELSRTLQLSTVCVLDGSYRVM